MKSSVFALTLFLSSAPAIAGGLQVELAPETAGSNKNIAADLQSGSFSWTQVDDANAARRDEDLSPLAAKLTRSFDLAADTSEEAVKAQLRVVVAELIEEAKRDNNVQSIRFKLRMRCVRKERLVEREAQDDPSRPLLWLSIDDGAREVSQAVQACAVELRQAVKYREEGAHMRPYSVLLAPAVEPKQ